LTGRKPRFLLDENLSHDIRRQLKRRDPSVDVVVVGEPDSPPLATPDPDILLWIEQTGYILVTDNRSTMAVHLAAHVAAGHSFPGILWLRPRIGLGVVINALFLIWSASQPEEYENRLLYIPL
jgi:hypothetical protein